jgi:hypothetical protein
LSQKPKKITKSGIRIANNSDEIRTAQYPDAVLEHYISILRMPFVISMSATVS